MAKPIPKAFPVRPLLTEAQRRAAKDPCQCLTCGRWWDDAVITSMTPAPSARCPFEYFHEEVAPGTNERRIQMALSHLREARGWLKDAGALKALARVRLAISSTKGALRHAELEPYRKARGAAR